MKVTDTTTGQQVSPDEAYERFFDGFFNLGRPGDIFERSVVLSRPATRPVAPPSLHPQDEESSHQIQPRLSKREA